MRSFKSVFGVIGALGPVLYCAGLVYYFVDLTGSVEQAEANGLGPTLLGLGAVGLLFSIPLIMKVVRILAARRSSGSGPDIPTDDGFDADAAVARYMARQTSEATPAAPPARAAPASRPSFGRKARRN